MAFIPDNGGEAGDRMRDLFGPAQIDHLIRQAVQMCWMGLPQERRSIDEVEGQVRRLVERALRDFREDRQAFGKPDGP